MLTLVHFYTFALLLDATMNMIVTEKKKDRKVKNLKYERTRQKST